MDTGLQIIVTVICSLFASGGFWACLTTFHEKKSSKTKMILGLGHNRIVELGRQYIAQGWISKDDYEDLHDYLYIPYKAMGGNGSAERIMKEVDKLPIK